jgi:hypothetical protein
MLFPLLSEDASFLHQIKSQGFLRYLLSSARGKKDRYNTGKESLPLVDVFFPPLYLYFKASKPFFYLARENK